MMNDFYSWKAKQFCFQKNIFFKFNQTGGGGIEGRSDTDLRIWATGDIGGERNESVFKSKEGFGIPRKDSLRA